MSGQRRDELEYWLTEHLRLNGVYWGLTALHLLDHPDALPRQEVIKFVMSCQSGNGGFGAAPRHDAHMLSTVSAVQILATFDALDELESEGRGGRETVGRCKYVHILFSFAAGLTIQILLDCKTKKLAPLLVMSGVRQIRGFSMALSMPCHCST
jgi:Prenyltransferase and squalene oxidase repeat